MPNSCWAVTLATNQGSSAGRGGEEKGGFCPFLSGNLLFIFENPALEQVSSSGSPPGFPRAELLSLTSRGIRCT